jgi:hypothetical protein
MDKVIIPDVETYDLPVIEIPEVRELQGRILDHDGRPLSMSTFSPGVTAIGWERIASIARDDLACSFLSTLK